MLDTFDPSPLSRIHLLCLSAMGDSFTVEELIGLNLLWCPPR